MRTRQQLGVHGTIGEWRSCGSHVRKCCLAGQAFRPPMPRPLVPSTSPPTGAAAAAAAAVGTCSWLPHIIGQRRRRVRSVSFQNVAVREKRYARTLLTPPSCAS
eukprot:6202415-Pleurochrysis_carterae.AAC.1